MRILAIETSCDDTGIAILEEKSGKFNVLSNIVSSQQIHQNYGGVFPMMAKREHQINIIPVLTESLKEAELLKEKKEITILDGKNLKDIFKKEEELYKLAKKFLENYEKPNIDAIAVTYGPGLEPCLWVGVNLARALSYFWNIPIIPVNHIEAHILVNFLENKNIKFPSISLIVSGGHTQLILMKGIGKYKIIGETRDDAAGECFDKCAKLLGLGYPGGPIISIIASEGSGNLVKLPRPMIHSKDYDFSFSGLKTAVLYEVKDKELTKEYVKNVAVGVQDAIIEVLLKKTLQAAKDYKVKTVILGGGVSANKELRKQLGEKIQQELPKASYLIPDAKLSTDNGLMIAVASYFHKTKKIAWQKLSANANLRIGG
ncbi:MAG: tRNA (adenosine(37)-N6)-threonylcarbamoyltransferase complex transferase subunit TsaD [Candidatus Staskawiczbacteria bacterium]|nr:tRNA (adenosine(37)-N6)-threonylcarbamoyltransferase complex transferase subunit TsaD [Candidatus Staskawiczbacteria bacterium]